MDNRTLIVTIVALGLVEVLTFLALALYRREPSLLVFAVGFAGSVVGVLLMLGQGNVTPWIGVVLSNLFALFLPLMLAIGFRRLHGMPVSMPRRFAAYLASFLLVVCGATFLFDSYVLRAVLFSGTSALLFLEVRSVARKNALGLSAFVRRLTLWLCDAVVAVYVLRIAVLVVTRPGGLLILQDTLVTPLTLLFLLVIAVLGANLVLLTDGARLVEDLKRKNDMLDSLSRTDSVTGLGNRSGFDRLGLDQPQVYGPEAQPTSLLLIDLDHFKRINDVYGHRAGDAALVRTAGLVRGLVRRTDEVYRWGGEEFLILARGTALPAATALAERIREAIEAPAGDQQGSFTASIGVAERRAGESRDDWFKRADEALYRAKDEGRNRVVAAT
jgi:diguanylate cyclase (GGDEF)-like protein